MRPILDLYILRSFSLAGVLWLFSTGRRPSPCCTLRLPTLFDLKIGDVKFQSLYLEFPNATIADEYDSSGCDPFEPTCHYRGIIVDIICIPAEGPTGRCTWGFSSMWFTIINCLIFGWAIAMYGIWFGAKSSQLLTKTWKKHGNEDSGVGPKPGHPARPWSQRKQLLGMGSAQISP
jgi:hypothetical protein